MRRKNKLKKEKGKQETNIRELRKKGISPQKAIRIAIENSPKKSKDK